MEIDATRQRLMAGFSNEPAPAPSSKTANKQPELDPALYPSPKASDLEAFASVDPSKNKSG